VKKEELLIFGSGSLARLAYYYARYEMQRKVLAFIVDESYKSINEWDGIPVISWESGLRKYGTDYAEIFVAVGYKSLAAKQTLFERAKDAGFSFASIIANSAYVAKTSVVGENNFLMPTTVVEPGVRLGHNNVLWSGSIVCHDTKINNHNFIAANVTLGGEVRVDCRCFFGFGATVTERLNIASDVVVGANSLMMDDGESYKRYYGAPAKAVRSEK